MFSPVFGGHGPYTGLIAKLRKVTLHPDAVRQFPYDWRLPVAYNTTLLAAEIDRHLTWWRNRSHNPEARLVLVAHSMGGLLCQQLHDIPGATGDVRDIVTLGTPFGGAAVAATVLGSGEGGTIPLPAQRLRRVGITMPGLYDLLPTYRAVLDGDNLRCLTAADISTLGGDTALADTALRNRTRLRDTPLPRHHALIGVQQPTMSSLTLIDGLATGLEQTYTINPDGSPVRLNNGRLRAWPGVGDGTVPRNASLPPRGATHQPVALQHMPLGSSPTAATTALDVIVRGALDDNPRLGPGDGIGLRAPDIVTPATEWTVQLTGETGPSTTVHVTDVHTNRLVYDARTHRRDGATHASIVLPAPGLYRIEVNGGAWPVDQYVLAEDPDATG